MPLFIEPEWGHLSWYGFITLNILYITTQEGVCQRLALTHRHLERRLPVSGLERGPPCHPERSEGSGETPIPIDSLTVATDCHPERSEGSGETAAQIQSSREDACPERSEGMTGLLSKCLSYLMNSRAKRYIGARSVALLSLPSSLVVLPRSNGTNRHLKAFTVPTHTRHASCQRFH